MRLTWAKLQDENQGRVATSKSSLEDFQKNYVFRVSNAPEKSKEIKCSLSLETTQSLEDLVSLVPLSDADRIWVVVG